MPLKASLFSKEMEVGEATRPPEGTVTEGCQRLGSDDAIIRHWGLQGTPQRWRKELRFLRPVVSRVTAAGSGASIDGHPGKATGRGRCGDQGRTFSELLEVPPRTCQKAENKVREYACSKD